jgi:quinol-cytochrome oxidoreductase complex cytochrome b subunit
LVRGSQYNPLAQFVFWVFVRRFIMLTFIGSCPIEPPFVTLGLLRRFVYFSFFLIYPLICLFWDRVMEKIIVRQKV